MTELRTKLEAVSVISVACPQPPHNCGWGPGTNVMDRLNALSADYAPRPNSTTGLEIRLVQAMERRTTPLLLTSSRRGFTKPYFRPCIEPILQSLWRNFQSWSINDVVLDELASSLRSERAERRNQVVWSSTNGNGLALRFPDASDISGWADRLRGAAGLEVHPILAAAYGFAEIVLSHPYGDGNGRLARAVFQGVLARTAGMSAPLAPLGPVLHRNKQGTAEAVVTLSQTGDWASFANEIVRAIDATLDLVEADRCRNPPAEGAAMGKTVCGSGQSSLYGGSAQFGVKG